MALRAGGEGRALLRGRLEAVDFPEELVQMAARAAEAEGRPMASLRLAPSFARSRLLEPRDRSLQRIRTLAAPGDVPERRLLSLGQLHAVEEEVAPAAQVDRMSIAP